MPSSSPQVALAYLTALVLLTNAKDCSLYEGFDDSRCFWGNQLTDALAFSSTYWMIEFYSSWCGHCQHFAPVWKEVATRVNGKHV